MDARTWNIVQLGIGFMLLFTGFNTQGFIEETVLNSVSDDTGRVDDHAGYYSLSIIYAVFTFASLVAPPIIAVFGAKWSMTLGGSTYVLFLASFFYINSWLLYFTSALLGFGAALLWNGQGKYLTVNSDTKTAGRHSGILWALFTCSLMGGGIFLAFVFDHTTTHISQSTIRTMYAFFVALSTFGVIILALLRSPPIKDELQEQPKQDHLKNLMSTFHLMRTKNMALLSGVSLYLGVEKTFMSGIYTTSLSFTQQFGSNENGLLAYTILALGAGQIVGGCAIQLISYVLIFFNIPTEAAVKKTNDISFFQPNMPLALLCGFLLGLGDSCWNTQLYSILATLYKDQSTQAFAVTRFFNSLSACAAYFYGSYLQLRFQLLIVVLGAVLAAICFFVVEREAKDQLLDKPVVAISEK